MSYITMADLGQSPPSPQKNAQQSWWDWFFGVGPKPAKRYKQAGILSTKPTAAAQRATFDSYTTTPSPAWGGEEFEAAADEDINVLAPQGSDSSALMADVNPVVAAEKSLPPPPSLPSESAGGGAKILAGAAIGGGILALLYGAMSTPGSGRRYNPKKGKKSRSGHNHETQDIRPHDCPECARTVAKSGKSGKKRRNG